MRKALRGILLVLMCAFIVCVPVGCKDKDPDFDIGDLTFNYVDLKVTSATEVSLYKGETYALEYSVKKGGVKVTGSTRTGENVGVYNRDAQVFVATGIGVYELNIVSTVNAHETAKVTINVVEQASGGGVVEPSSAVAFKKAEEEGEYAFGEMMFESGEKDYWAEHTLPQRFGFEGEAEISYDIADDGIYYYIRVNDSTLFKGKGTGEKKIEDSDRIEIHFDSLHDGGDKPKTDDYRIRVTCDGSYDVSVGTGSDWKVNPNFKLDAVRVARIGGDEMGTVTERGNAGAASSRDVDSGYEVKLFMSYNNFSFSKRDDYGITFAHADFVDAAGDQRFVASGDVNMPDQFRPMSAYGIGTLTQLTETIDGYKSSFYDDAEHFTVDGLYYGLVTGNGKVTCDTYVKFADDGVYLLVQTTQDKLTYQYVTGGHTWKSDHFEIRVDTNGDEANQSTLDGDRYLHVDISGTTLAAYGITDDSRKTGEYNYLAAIKTVGDVENFSGTVVPVNTVGKPEAAHEGDGKKHIYFEMFMPYDAFNLQSGNRFGLMVSYGNPKANATGIGNVFNTSNNTSLSVIDIYNQYGAYRKFTAK